MDTTLQPVAAPMPTTKAPAKAAWKLNMRCSGGKLQMNTCSKAWIPRPESLSFHSDGYGGIVVNVVYHADPNWTYDQIVTEVMNYVKKVMKAAGYMD